VLAPALSAPVAALFPPLALLTHLNNLGLKQSVRVSRVVMLVNLAIMAVTIVGGWICLALQGVDLRPVLYGAGAPMAGDPGASGTTAASCRAWR
jgi:hypothetical protein